MSATQSGHLSALALTPKTLAKRIKIKLIWSYNWLTNFSESMLPPCTDEKEKLTALRTLWFIGRSREKRVLAWAIFAGREKKPLLAGSFYGTLPDAKKHAGAAISRLNNELRNKDRHPHNNPARANHQ